MTTTDGTRSTRVDVRTIVAVVVAVALVVWVLANRQPVNISFWVVSATLPLWVALSVSIVLGCAVGFLLGRSRYRP